MLKKAETLENPKPARFMTEAVEEAIVKQLDKKAKDGMPPLAVQERQPTKVECGEVTEENRYAKTAEAVLRLKVRRKLCRHSP